MEKRKNIIITLVVFLYFLLAAIIVTYPLVFHLKDYVFGLGDELLITWIINWDIHAIIHNIPNIYNANILYPLSGTLTFSDAFLTSAFIGLIPKLIFKEPLIAYNVNIFVSIITLGFFTYLFIRYISKNHFAGIISGTIISFSLYSVTHYFHLQLISIEWMPLAFLFFAKYLNTKRVRYITGISVCFILQAANSFFPVYLMGFSFSVIFLYLYFTDKKTILKFADPKIYILLFITLLGVYLLSIPYFHTSSSFNYVRDIRDTIRFANRPEYFLYPSYRSRLQSTLINLFYRQDENPIKHDGYLGFTVLVVGGGVILYNFYHYKRLKNKYIIIFLLITGVAYILSLGPALQWRGKVIKHPFIFPLPYVLFYYLLPGFKGFRNSARWELLVVFSIATIIGLFFAEKVKKRNILLQLAITILICSSVFAEINWPFHYEKVPLQTEYPSVYSYIDTLPENTAIVEMPIYNWNMTPYAMIEFMRLIYSTKHYRNMVNGTTGFYPPEWEKRTLQLYLNFPDRKTIQYLKNIKVSYVILHADEYNMLAKNNYILQGKKASDWNSVKKILDGSKDLQFIKSLNSDYVYKVR